MGLRLTVQVTAIVAGKAIDHDTVAGFGDDVSEPTLTPKAQMPAGLKLPVCPPRDSREYDGECDQNFHHGAPPKKIVLPFS